MTVFVTGATGFLAQHIIAQLLSANYKVIGTVRSNKKGEKLSSNFGSPNFHYEILPDIRDHESLVNALSKHPQIEYVIHSASPVTFNVEDPENDILLPAVNGTKNVFSSILEAAPQVKKIIYTSSNAAIGNSENEISPSVLNNEDSWNPITWEESKLDSYKAYKGSKTYSERFAWDFKKQNNLKLTTICPTYIFGPQLFDEYVSKELNLSNEIINLLVNSEKGKPYLKDMGGYIDVRDVAKAHVQSLTDPKTDNERLYLYNGRFTEQTILDILNSLPELNGVIAKGDNIGSDDFCKVDCLMIDNSKTKEILGFEFKLLEESVVDVAKQIIDFKNN